MKQIILVLGLLAMLIIFTTGCDPQALLNGNPEEPDRVSEHLDGEDGVDPIDGKPADPGDTEEKNIDFDYENFKKMRDAWQAKGINNYSYHYHRVGNPKIDYKIIVKNNSVDEVICLEECYPDFPTGTINDLFDNIEKFYLDAESQYDPSADIVLEKIITEYDCQYHFVSKYLLKYKIKPGVVVSMSPGNFTIDNFIVKCKCK